MFGLNKNEPEQRAVDGIVLGKKYQDKITDFSGVAVAICVYLTGCTQTLLVPKMGADGKRPEGEWFDNQRLVEIPAEPITVDNSQNKGCDIPAPKI